MTNPLELPGSEKLLVKLLAGEFALHAPFRAEDWNQPGATTAREELQSRFRQIGLVWTPGGSVAERKAGEALISELRRAGLITATGRTNARHVRMTDEGRWLASALCDATTLVDGFDAVGALLYIAPAGALVSELLLTDMKDYDDPECASKLSGVQQVVTPAIMAGWIDSASDRHGRVAYRVTPEGKAARETPKPRKPDGLPLCDNELVDLFDRECDAERERLLTVEPVHSNEIGPLPLSAGLWCNAVGPWNWSDKSNDQER